MLLRYFTTLIVLFMAALLLHKLLTDQQKQALGAWIGLIAKLLLIISLLAILWHLF